MSQLQRYKTNPFVDDIVIRESHKQVVISPFGKDNNILVNQDTGEILGGTSVVTYKRVDEQEFVKLFTQNIALTFNLKSSGIKAFNVLLFAVQKYCIGKDRVSLDSYMLNEFLEHNNNNIALSLSTFKRGLNELEQAKIIAKTLKLGDYFINPNFMFNGNRIAFTTVIEKEKAIKRQEIREQKEAEKSEQKELLENT